MSSETTAPANSNGELALQIPLRLDSYGVWRVIGTRITLGLVVDCFERGWSPVEIASRYDSLKLTDVYQVVSFYLTQPERVKAMLVRENELAEENIRRVEADPAGRALREKILARWAERQKQPQAA